MSRSYVAKALREQIGSPGPTISAGARRGNLIVGKTPTGRATIAAVRLNRAELVEARRGWVIAGWHPPKD